jgi:hypothetical protein
VNGPFHCRLYVQNADGSISQEEKIRVTSRSGLNLTIEARGVDGTSAQAHAAGTRIEHCSTAIDFDESNRHINDTTQDNHTQYLRAADAGGDGLGTVGRVLSVNVDGTGIQIVADTLSLKDGGVTGPKILDGSISTAKIADSAVTSAKIAANTIVAADIAANTITATEIAANAITNSELADGAVDTLATFGSLVRPVQIVSSGTHPGSPSIGDHIFELDTGADLTYQSATTGWTRPWNVAWGYLAVAQVTANQGSIGTATDLTSLTSGAITFVANRQVRISGYIAALGAAGGGLARLDIKESATILASDQEIMQTSNTGLRAVAIISPSAGAHTYKLTFGRTSGADTLTMVASSTAPAFILVEDIGPLVGSPPI